MQVASFKEAEKRELETMMQLRAKNIRKRMEDNPEAKYCICNKAMNNSMVQCELCKDCFHGNSLIIYFLFNFMNKLVFIPWKFF